MLTCASCVRCAFWVYRWHFHRMNNFRQPLRCCCYERDSTVCPVSGRDSQTLMTAAALSSYVAAIKLHRGLLDCIGTRLLWRQHLVPQTAVVPCWLKQSTVTWRFNLEVMLLRQCWVAGPGKSFSGMNNYCFSMNSVMAVIIGYFSRHASLLHCVANGAMRSAEHNHMCW